MDDYRYIYYGAGFGKIYKSKLLEEYNERIGELTISEPFSVSKEFVESILKESLKNGLTFYENAPKAIKENMEFYVFALENGMVF